MSQKFSLTRKAAYAGQFPFVRLRGYPTLVNIEVTKRCNARCDFCDYWKTKQDVRLDDYAPVLARLKPLVIMLTGGEPLLRPDLEQVIRRIRAHSGTPYLGLITNAALLSVQRGIGLWEAGLDQFTISLDFLDERHDRARGIPGLARKILETAPRLVEAGIGNLVFNTVIKSDNLDQIRPIIEWASPRGIKVSLSAYNNLKTGDGGHRVGPDQRAHLQRLVDELISLRRTDPTLLSSTYYLSQIPEFFEQGGIGACVAGRRFVSVTPDGHLKRCAEFAEQCHFSAWTPQTFSQTDCRTCWVSCRGEAQAPLSLERLKQVLAL